MHIVKTFVQQIPILSGITTQWKHTNEIEIINRIRNLNECIPWNLEVH